MKIEIEMDLKMIIETFTYNLLLNGACYCSNVGLVKNTKTYKFQA